MARLVAVAALAAIVALLPGRIGGSGPGQTGPGYDDRTSAVSLLASYYDAVNRQDYQRAYGYWRTPPGSFEAFAQGYADTAGVQVIVEPPTSVDVGAGNLFVSIATVLVATQRDGSRQVYAGCYVMHRSNLRPPDVPEEPVWAIARANIAPVALDAAIPALLQQGCP